jgi:hypothetical protein
MASSNIGARALAAAMVLSAIAEHRDPALVRALVRAAVLAGRRVGRFNSLTGAWSGEYQYPAAVKGVRRVPFNARIDEAGGSFTGEIDEPNTYADPSAPRLFATISGTRTGSAVSFIKTMDGTGGATHSIIYDGAVNSNFTRIEGRWRTIGAWSGPFFMEREGAMAEEAASRAESAGLEQ